MRPPKGFESEKFPLRHRLVFGAALSLTSDNQNTVLFPIVRSSTDVPIDPGTIKVNPHNSDYVEDGGPLCGAMSIVDRMTISLKFNMTHYCEPARLVSGTAGPNFDDGTYQGDDVNALTFKWRPIFNVYPEKMDAADDQTGTTVAAILGMTKDTTNEDVVPITTNDLPVQGPAETLLPVSTRNHVEVFGDYNMTTDLIIEDHVFDETLLQTALRRYTNKGALRSCLGRTRNVTLSRNRNFANFYIDKFVPRAIRRIQPYAFFGIQVHLPLAADIGQQYLSRTPSATVPHLGIKCIVNYHEWNSEHDQDRGTPA